MSFKNAKWFLILLITFYKSDLEILEGEVKEELANERNLGCFIEEDKALESCQKTSLVLDIFIY
jgi:hypothetical protein